MRSIVDRIYDEYIKIRPAEQIYFSSDIPIIFDPSWNKIGINLSGGADSAFLFSSLITHAQSVGLTPQFHVISHVRCWDVKPWQKHYRVNVFDYIRNKFNYENIVVHENFVPPEIEMAAIGQIIPTRNGMKAGCQIEGGSYAKYIAWRERIPAMFDSTTMNPLHLQDSRAATHRNISDETINIDDLIVKSKMTTMYRPFHYIQKNKLISAYRKLDWMDIFNITRSCEGSGDSMMEAYNKQKEVMSLPNIPDDYFSQPAKYYKEGDYIPECNNCWWCDERKWALNE